MSQNIDLCSHFKSNWLLSWRQSKEWCVYYPIYSIFNFDWLNFIQSYFIYSLKWIMRL